MCALVNCILQLALCVLDTHRHVGIVERITISRSGEFSCPVQSGVIFMGHCNIADWATQPDEAVLKRFQVCQAGQMFCSMPGLLLVVGGHHFDCCAFWVHLYAVWSSESHSICSPGLHLLAHDQILITRSHNLSN